MEIGRPSTKAQSSRKSKKAWRKNIDLEDLSSGLETAREYERAFGMKENELETAQDELLFEVDAAGDEGLKTRRERNVKHMKMDEILDRSGKYANVSESAAASVALGFASKHPGLSKLSQQKPQKSEEKRFKKKNHVTKKDLQRLKRLAGHKDADSVSSTQAVVESSGFQSVPVYDAWDDAALPDSTPESVTKETKFKHTVKVKKTNKKKDPKAKEITSTPAGLVPTVGSFIDGLTPTISFIKPQKAPSTLSEAPNAVYDPETDPKARKDAYTKKAVPLPDAGNSYNPTLEDWSALINKEHALEEKREEQRKELEKERGKLEILIERYTKPHNLELSIDSDDSEDEDEDEEEAADEGEQAEGDEEKKGNGLSVNPPVEAKKKTKTQRNRQKRHVEKMKLEQELKAVRQQLKRLENIPELLQELEKQVKAATNEEDENEKTYDADKKRKRVTKKRHERIVQMPLDIKLSDELTDSLRLLKPEGNLALERFRSFQARGLVELPGSTQSKKRKTIYKEVEKMTYKYLFD